MRKPEYRQSYYCDWKDKSIKKPIDGDYPRHSYCGIS